MKTSELIGPALNYTVAIAQGAKIEPQSGGRTWLVDGAMLGYVRSYIPSEDWEQGGPIIECEEITITHWIHPKNYWRAGLTDEDGKCYWQDGPTPLIAAMRCYVASKLGDDVEIPDELK